MAEIFRWIGTQFGFGLLHTPRPLSFQTAVRYRWQDETRYPFCSRLNRRCDRRRWCVFELAVVRRQCAQGQYVVKAAGKLAKSDVKAHPHVRCYAADPSVPRARRYPSSGHYALVADAACCGCKRILGMHQLNSLQALCRACRGRFANFAEAAINSLPGCFGQSHTVAKLLSRSSIIIGRLTSDGPTGQASGQSSIRRGCAGGFRYRGDVVETLTQDTRKPPRATHPGLLLMRRSRHHALRLLSYSAGPEADTHVRKRCQNSPLDPSRRPDLVCLVPDAPSDEFRTTAIFRN
jgi:hypothetical protein